MQSEVLVESRRLLRMLLSDREAAIQRMRRGVGIARAHVLFRGAEIGRRVNASGYARVSVRGRMVLGDHVDFTGGMIPSVLSCHEGAELVIGDGCGFNYGVAIDCRRSIHIGARCMFGSMTRLIDSDGARIAPIVIEDDVWIAYGAVIRPGVRIGAGSVVSAGSVVISDVPRDSLAVGNPAESFPRGPEA